MSKNIVERLEELQGTSEFSYTPEKHAAIFEAADEITRLRELADARLKQRWSDNEEYRAEITRLRAEVERLTLRVSIQADALVSLHCYMKLHTDSGLRESCQQVLDNLEWLEEDYSRFVSMIDDDLQQQIDRLTLRWTDQPPTEPGWYWWKRPGVLIAVCRTAFECNVPGVGVVPNEEMDRRAGQWSDKPIPEPTDTPSTGS